MSNSALLAQIQQGKKLRKAETNDRSTPLVEGAVKSGAGTARGGGGGSTMVAGGAPQLGGLFAGGIPKLKPAGQAAALGKPPTIPKGVSVPPTPPSRAAPRLPPAREAPPGRPPPPPAASASPRRPPRPPRPISPPPRPISPPPRPTSAAPSTPSRLAPPPPPARPSPTQSPALPPRKVPPPPTSSGRPPPPPPPRPTSTAKPSTTSQPARAVPPPPSRKLPQQISEEPVPQRVRSVSTGGFDAPPKLPGPSPARSSIAPPPPRAPPGPPPVGIRGASPGRRAVSVSNVNGTRPTNGAKTARIPSPPPSSGPHTFPSSSDFPPPRAFVQSSKKYASGNVRGSSFDVSALA